jgi:hypothetical protein
MNEKCKQMADGLYLLTRMPTNGELLLCGWDPFGIPLLPGWYDILPREPDPCAYQNANIPE